MLLFLKMLLKHIIIFRFFLYTQSVCGTKLHTQIAEEKNGCVTFFYVQGLIPQRLGLNVQAKVQADGVWSWCGCAGGHKSDDEDGT